MLLAVKSFSIGHILFRSIKLRSSFKQCSTSAISSFNQSPGVRGDSDGTYRPVVDFYTGKSIFMTGGTGFLGKVITEKLLYTCAGIDKIYLLVRVNNGEDPQQRINQMVNNPLFNRLKENMPHFLGKLVAIQGDVGMPNLGIKPVDEEILKDKVSIVFHSAATVKFNEPLKVSLNINLEGTQRVLSLCKKMKNIEAFVHMSTAFAYALADAKEIKEVLYPPPSNANEVYQFAEKYNLDEKKTAAFLKDRPNTYTYAKAMAETYIAEHHSSVPAAIIRPSIVTPILGEPIPGWLDNWFGATRLLFNVAAGWNRVTLGKKENLVDLIPVDYVVNLAIVAAARLNRAQEVQVYNSCSSSVNPLIWSDSYTAFIKYAVKRRMNEFSYPCTLFTDSRFVVSFLTFLLQVAPATVADFLLWITNNNSRYSKTQKRVISTRDSVDYFTSRSWVMECRNTQALAASLSPIDRQQFPCDPSNIEWNKYLQIYCRGVYEYLLKRPTSKL